MLSRFDFRLLLLVAIVSFNSVCSSLYAGVVVADRLTNSVYLYRNDGTYAGLVVSDATNLSQPSSIAVSPTESSIFVTSTLNNRVVRYDYNPITALATNPTIFADSTDGLSFPSDVRFSQDGSRIYVSNLGGTGVAQFNLDGSSAGAPINGLVAGGSIFQYSGLAFAPDGDLLIGGFQDFPAGTQGAVARSNDAITSLGDFIGPSTSLNGASSLLVNGNDLYVTGGFAGTVQKFNATTGALDTTFNGNTGVVGGLAFPQDLLLAPDGNGILVGILGVVDGSGSIARYSFDGSFLGTFASSSPGSGFSEPTSFARVSAIPEPATFGLVVASLSSLGLVRRRRAAAIA